MADSRVLEAMDEQSRMEAGRSNFDTLWQDVADRVDPMAGFFTKILSPGQQRTEKMFDSTAAIALGRATAAFESFCTPRTQKWQGLVPSSAGLRKDHAVMMYLEAFRDLLFQVRYSSKSGFANQNSGFLRSFLNYGNGILYVDDDPGKSLRYKNIALPESYFGEDHTGRIDRFHRRFKLTARQVGIKFGEAALSPKLRDMAQKQPDAELDLIHRVCANHDLNPRRKDYAGMPLLGYYIVPMEDHVLDMSGFRSMPYQVSRYRVNAREVYGRGPVMDILATIKTVNEMQKTNLRVGQRTAAPPLLAYRDGIQTAFNMRSDHVNYGALDEQGRALVKPLETNGQLPVSLEMQQAEREVIQDALFIEIFNVLRDNPQMTATQTLQLVQERGVLMAPSTGNLQTGAYGPMTEREIELLSAIGGGDWLAEQIGDMPESLANEGGAYEIEFDAPINRAQKAEEGVAILQTIQDAIPLAQIEPGILKVFKLRDSIRALAEIRGVPARLLATDEEIEAQDEEDASAAQLQQLLAAAPVAASSVKDLAQAQAIAGTSPQAPASLVA